MKKTGSFWRNAMQRMMNWRIAMNGSGLPALKAGSSVPSRPFMTMYTAVFWKRAYSLSINKYQPDAALAGTENTRLYRDFLI